MKKNYIKPVLNVVNVEMECAICAASGTSQIIDGSNGGASIDFGGEIGSGDAISAHSREGGFSVWGDDEE